ncbi:hypothetical protein FGO68_gene1978 [Halteria grandinella]|uniref:Uncharacterized protein n=1 Tax=Halteria grandinella TaxID=5974 RepID=A0A8J8NNT7_HALGN|nr:hypothetical protein FGO68_gene1978 [Halteria grandinella]
MLASALESVDSGEDVSAPIVTGDSKLGQTLGALLHAQQILCSPQLPQHTADQHHLPFFGTSTENRAQPHGFEAFRAPARQELDPSLLEPVTQGQFKEMMSKLDALTDLVSGMSTKLDKVEKTQIEIQAEQVTLKQEVEKVQAEVGKVQAEVVKVQVEQERMAQELKGVNERLTKVEEDVRQLKVGREQIFSYSCMQ